MIASLIRQLKRLFVLLPGLIIAYIAVRDIYPALDIRFPRAFAILFTYMLTAYGLIPLFLRFINIFSKPKHIPLYTTTPDGFACDPVNIGIVGTRAKLISTMEEAGWYQADRRTLPNVIKMIISIILHRPYRHAPFSNLYLFGRSQDIGFQLPLDNNPRHRHHVRFWAATYSTDIKYRDHVHFWQKHHHAKTPKRILWVGAVSMDTGIGVIRHNAQFTHMIHPDTNAERELLVSYLLQTHNIKKVRRTTLSDAYRITNRVLRGYMLADGEMAICELK